MATLTKELRKAIESGPFAGKDLLPFFGTKKAAERFLADFTQARDEAVRDEKYGRRAADCTFPEQFWDGRLFLDSDEMYDIHLDRAGLDGFRCLLTVSDEALDADLYVLRHGRRLLFVVDWSWKEDEYALDAWWLT
jgi:hypothetical protein